jgi:hypothetical protein
MIYTIPIKNIKQIRKIILFAITNSRVKPLIAFSAVWESMVMFDFLSLFLCSISIWDGSHRRCYAAWSYHIFPFGEKISCGMAATMRYATTNLICATCSSNGKSRMRAPFYCVAPHRG